MIEAIDTSVIIAAFSDWHEHQHVALEALATKPMAIAHSLIEAMSALTRMPEPMRANPKLVATFLDDSFEADPLTMPAGLVKSMPTTLVQLGISGGPIYDALIALTAKANDATLLTLDRRAERTYQRCGVDYRVIGSPNG